MDRIRVRHCSWTIRIDNQRGEGQENAPLTVKFPILMTAPITVTLCVSRETFGRLSTITAECTVLFLQWCMAECPID